MFILSNGSPKIFQISAAHIDACKHLTNDVDLFFEISDDAVLLPLEKLILSRARPEGIKAAASHMFAAANGGHRRRPITVQETTGDRYIVLDGNSTTVALASAGQTHVWVKVEK